MAEESQELAKQIYDAFVNSSYPGDELIVPKVQYDDETQITEAAFLGKGWQVIDPTGEDFDYPCNLFFLTEEAFRYYLPAFLIASLDFERAPRITSLFFWRLSSDRDSEPSSELRALRADLTEPQYALLRAVFDHFVARYSYLEFDKDVSGIQYQTVRSAKAIRNQLLAMQRNGR